MTKVSPPTSWDKFTSNQRTANKQMQERRLNARRTGGWSKYKWRTWAEPGPVIVRKIDSED